MSFDASEQVLIEHKNGVGYITLNRPAALNTINLPMVRAIQKALTEWVNKEEVKAIVIQGNGEKAFCAGGDVRRVYDCIKEGSADYEQFFKEEFDLDKLIYEYPKPCIALMHGIVMGGGMGLTQGAKTRVVCENTKIAMPETAIGYFPDVGASYFLTRKNAALAVYLGVTGKLLKPEDTLYCGLADWILPINQWDRFKFELENLTQPQYNSASISVSITSLLKKLGASNSCVESEIKQHMDSITEVFSNKTIHEIYSKLHSKVEDPWSKETLEGMKKNSPLAMAVSQQLLHQGCKLNLHQAFDIELELNYLWKTKGEFVEGVRAALIDKDKKPMWRYALEDITTDFLRNTFPPIYKY